MKIPEQRGGTDGHLHRAVAKDGAAHRPQRVDLHFEADYEHHQNDAQLGKVEDRVDVGHELQYPGADHDARQQIAEHCPKAEANGQWHGDQRRRKEDDHVDQQHSHALTS